MGLVLRLGSTQFILADSYLSLSDGVPLGPLGKVKDHWRRKTRNMATSIAYTHTCVKCEGAPELWDDSAP